MTSECTLAMMTHNSAVYLPFILPWCRVEFEDFVAIDGNSTDDTQKLLKEAGANLMVGGPTDNFAALRNKMLDMARFDWVFEIDADEMIDCMLLRNLPLWIKPDSELRLPHVVAFKMPRYNTRLRAWPDQQIRLVNRKSVEWDRPIHEIAVHKETRRPIDEPRNMGNGEIRNYCQSLDHPIIHLDWVQGAQVDQARRTRWQQLEDKTGIRPP